MPLKDMLLCCHSKKGLTTIFELRSYFKQKEAWPMQLSVQGYLQQRKRLNPEVFSYLNSEYLKDFYSSNEVELWNGYLLLAIDGSKAEVPNSRENRDRFGKSNNQHSQAGQVRALVSGMYDILNRFYLDIGIEHISISEKQPTLVIFDRGYPAIEFVDFLKSHGIHYVFRLSSNDYIERAKMKSSDETVLLKHTSQRLMKISKKHPERYDFDEGLVNCVNELYDLLLEIGNSKKGLELDDIPSKAIFYSRKGVMESPLMEAYKILLHGYYETVKKKINGLEKYQSLISLYEKASEMQSENIPKSDS